MSKFADRIRKVSRPQSHSLGFGPSAKNAVVPTMVLVGVAANAKEVPDLTKRGADIVLVGGAEAPATANSADAGDAIRGAWIAGTKDDEAREFREAGFDFVLVDPDRASATALLDENIGYVMALPRDLTDVEVRALEGFQLDALYVGALNGTLTVRRQIDLQRLFALTRKPLMATIAADTSVSELQALRDTNVVVVAAEGADAVEKLRKTIDALPPRTRRKDEERPLPFVPRSVAAAAAPDEDDHEHDHD